MRKNSDMSGIEFRQRTIDDMKREKGDSLFMREQRIVHVHLYDKGRGCFSVLFRPCGRPAPISGKIESGESPELTSIREIREEIGIRIDRVYKTGHSFIAISPKGKKICGTTYFALLAENIDPQSFSFNSEVSGFLWSSANDTFSILSKEGFPEALSGFEYLMAKQLIDRAVAASEKSK